jgi:hypothetical protein
MYCVVSASQQIIINSVTPDEVSEYDWLRLNVPEADRPDYQRRYRNFWAMNAAQLNGDFYALYFKILKEGTALPLGDLCQRLYDASVRRNGARTLQFSFATKLLHPLSPHLPVCDSFVARFFLFQAPPSDMPLKERVDDRAFSR